MSILPHFVRRTLLLLLINHLMKMFLKKESKLNGYSNILEIKIIYFAHFVAQNFPI